MVGVKSFKGSYEGAGRSDQHGMIIEMLDGNGGCRLNFPVILRTVTSAVAADLRSRIRKRGGKFY